MKKDKPKLRAAPPKRELDDFLGGANEPPAREERPAAAPKTSRPPRPEPQAAALPWEEPGIEREGKKMFNVRFQPRHFYMLQWLAATTRRESMQSLALDILEPAIEEAVRRRSEAEGE